MFDEQTCVKPCPCPRCDRVIDAASGPTRPRKDDVSICIYCGAMLFFNEDLTLREATPEEERTALENSYVRRFFEVSREFIKKQRH